MPLTIDSSSYSSPNYDSRKGHPIDSIVIHTTEGKWPGDINWLCSRKSQVSCHYVIAPDAKVYQIVDDKHRAWHAGVGSYMGINDWNTGSLGIEISKIAGNAYRPGQREVCAELCRMLIPKYRIMQHLIAAHRWIAPERRSDPSDWPDKELRPWIAGLYDQPVPVPPQEMVYLTCAVNTNLRQGPAKSYPVVLVMPLGTTAGYDEEPTTGESIGGNDDWYHRADGLGFASATCLVQT